MYFSTGMPPHINHDNVESGGVVDGHTVMRVIRSHLF